MQYFSLRVFLKSSVIITLITLRVLIFCTPSILLPALTFAISFNATADDGDGGDGGDGIFFQVEEQSSHEDKSSFDGEGHIIILSRII